MVEPDGETLRAAAGGDVAAFEIIVRFYQPRVWRYVCGLVSDPELANDITQEVFIKVHGRLSGIRRTASFAAWIYTIARNAAYDALRSRRRKPRGWPLLDTDHPMVPDPHLGIEIEQALRHLGADEREAIVLIGMLGLPYDEAATTVGVPTGTMKSRVFRARQQLLAWFEETGESTDAV